MRKASRALPISFSTVDAFYSLECLGTPCLQSAFCGELFEGTSCVSEMLGRIIDEREPSLEDAITADLRHGVGHLQRIISLYALTAEFVEKMGSFQTELVKPCFKP